MNRYLVISADFDGGHDYQWVLDLVLASDPESAESFIAGTRDSSDIKAFSLFDWRELANTLENMDEDEIRKDMQELEAAHSD